ncbi:putative NPH3 domain-containing protein [Helianthus annuus]|nr:putative NPH3 domain-containing protein [Helianthus annuus]
MAALKSGEKVPPNLIGASLKIYTSKWLLKISRKLENGFFLKLLKGVNVFQASGSSKLELARRVALQLDEAKVCDLMIPSVSNGSDTIYNVDKEVGTPELETGAIIAALDLYDVIQLDFFSVNMRENYATWSMLIKAWKEYVDKSMEYVETICNYSQLGVTAGRHLVIFARLRGLIPSSLTFIS